jgi:hypothetical protein
MAFAMMLSRGAAQVTLAGATGFGRAPDANCRMSDETLL